MTASQLVGNRLAHARADRGLEQQQVAYDLKITRQTLSNWEHGRTEAPYGVLYALADLYGVSVRDFWPDRTA